MANPQLASAIAADRAGQLEHDAVTSCIMCRERLVAEGKPSLHMLDLLYPGESLHAAATAKGSGLSARRAGRAALRTEVLRRYAGESVAETADDGIPVRIGAGCLGKDGRAPYPAGGRRACRAAMPRPPATRS